MPHIPLALPKVFHEASVARACRDLCDGHTTKFQRLAEAITILRRYRLPGVNLFERVTRRHLLSNAAVG